MANEITQLMAVHSETARGVFNLVEYSKDSKRPLSDCGHLCLTPDQFVDLPRGARLHLTIRLECPNENQS